MQLLQLPHPRVPRSSRTLLLSAEGPQLGHLLPGALEPQEAGGTLECEMPEVRARV